MKARPLVSIIIPSFNQGKYIRETIDSIISQDYRPIEALILDGGSTDDTLSVLESFENIPELKWWSESDNGVTDAVNKGLRRAKGEIFAIQSSDDVYLPGAFSEVVEFIGKHSDVALVYGDVELMNEDSQIIGRDVQGPFNLRHYLGRFSYVPQPSAFFRANVAKEIGCWRQEVSYSADADYWLRLAVRHRVVKLDRLIGRYRYHSGQRDKQSFKIARDWERTIRDLLANTHLDKTTRRFARMGIQLAKYRYEPEPSWIKRTWHLYRAVVANPVAVFYPQFPKCELLIGRQPIWKILSRIKRLLGCKPKAA